MEISLCMIVKDEEETLERCLKCVQGFADEIIIVDTGSKDHTKDIAYQYTDQVYDFIWVDDFSKARNEAFSYATKDYVMWLDADDVIDQENIEKIKKLKETLSCLVDIVFMKYKMGKESDYVFYRERLVKRSRNYRWKGNVHECIECQGKSEYSDITILHQKEHVQDPKRNLRIYEKMIQEGKILETREIFYYARELMEHQSYEKAIDYFMKFLNRSDAWIENQIEACLNMSYCYQKINNDGKALQCLFDSFLLDTPRSEILCEIATLFLSHHHIIQAIYWYQKALENHPDEKNGGFIRKDCYDYIPYIQLCVCYDRLGDKKQASIYNELAGKIKPEDASYLYNKNYFKEKENSSY